MYRGLAYSHNNKWCVFIFFLQMYLSFHSYGQKVLYPWSYSAEKVPDWVDLHDMGIVIGEAMRDATHGRTLYTVR